jgi:hypothetical protein
VERWMGWYWGAASVGGAWLIFGESFTPALPWLHSPAPSGEQEAKKAKKEALAPLLPEPKITKKKKSLLKAKKA